MKRRKLLATAIAASLWPWLQSSGQAQVAPSTSGIIKPRRLQAGDRVAIVSPASATFLQEQVDIVVDAVRGLGLEPFLAPHVQARYGSLAGTDAQRAADLNQCFADPSITALLPIQGGWGSSRLLPLLDYDSIRTNPKILVGFSDITSLLLGIHAQTGLVTFHGPNGLTAWRPNQTEPFRQVLFAGEMLTFRNQQAAEDGDRLMNTRFRLQTITSGEAQGPLIGGNLTVLSGIVGSPYLPDLSGAILFLEDIGEETYRIDRLMTHLRLAGVFDQLAGFIFGQCVRCNPAGGYGSLTLEEIVWSHIAPLGIPAWYGAMIGHIEPMLTVPIGTQVAVNSDRGTIQMLESAVHS